LVAPQDEVFEGLGGLAGADDPDDPDDPDRALPDAPLADTDDDAIVAGTLRSPWKWEELIVESAVVGGRTRLDGRARWRRRLDGLSADYHLRLDELRRDEPESPKVARFERDLRNLRHLRTFALPVIDELAEWPDRATWGGWLERFEALASRTLSQPGRVLQTLAELRPMASVGPIGLEEARDVLRERLVTLDRDPPAKRYGKVFVGTPHQARGRTFRVVFVPGLAERVVPQRPREDPLLLDNRRHEVDPALMDQERRGGAERLLLKIAIGAASERLYLSYPRMDVAETRARVPSFYALDVMRAITGRVPDHRVLAAEAAEEAGATLAWPAPKDPDQAIDDLEHDLSVLKPLLDSRDTSVKGRAHYMLGLNEALRRSVVSRWSRGRSTWSSSDGIVTVTPGIDRAMAAQRLAKRPYSLSALQRFGTCPYQFLLATIHRLEPWDEPEPLLRMDPLTRGSLFHKVQAELLRELKAHDELPVTKVSVPSAATRLEAVLARVSSEYAEQLAPAIDRVWRDEIADLGRDLAIWVRRMADETDWRPEYFEFSFGLGVGASPAGPTLMSGATPSGPGIESRLAGPTFRSGDTAAGVGEDRDPRSVPDPVLVDGRFLLRGSVDLIEERSDTRVLRVTDHKTGKNRSKSGLIVDGGKVLQPVLYSAVVEQALQQKVIEGRLFYCTTAGGFADHSIRLDDYERRQGLEVLTIIDRAVERGFLVAAPDEGACRWCDFRAVCGPREEERTARKNPKDLADLRALRSMR
jgi:CRISPR/Cas system-associated exonuclease Cas4 (RecB family)